MGEPGLLSPFEQWMVKSNLDHIANGEDAAVVIATLRANGNDRIAEAVAAATDRPERRRDWQAEIAALGPWVADVLGGTSSCFFCGAAYPEHGPSCLFIAAGGREP